METNLITQNNNYSLSDLEIISKKAAQSNLLGSRNENEVFTLLMLAQAEGKNPVQACMDYSIIQGKPALKSQAILVRFQKSGGRIRYIKRDDTECTIEFSHHQAGELTITWTMETAKQAGLNINRENWRKYPRQMLSARCIAEGVRALYPACLDGLYAAEEVQDFNTVSNNTEVHTVDTVYDINTDSYVNKEPDYRIVPNGANKGKLWADLDINVLIKAKQYYTEKEYSIEYRDIISEVLENKLSICPTGVCKDKRWADMSIKELEDYYKKYKNGKLIGYAQEYAEYIANILLNKQSEDSIKKQADKKETQNNMQVDEDEDPFSSANDNDWDTMIEDQTKKENEPPHQLADDNEEDGFDF